jgi:hypothetical protein
MDDTLFRIYGPTLMSLVSETTGLFLAGDDKEIAPTLCVSESSEEESPSSLLSCFTYICTWYIFMFYTQYINM